MADASSSESTVRVEPSGGLQRYLAALAGFDRNVKLFLTVTAFRGMVIAALQTVLNLYLYSLGYDQRFIGLINGVNALAVLLVSVPLGYLADRLGRKPVLLVGGTGYPLSILALSLMHSTAGIMLFNFLFGAFSSAYWVAGVPLLFASTTEQNRVQAFSINSFLLWGLGPLGALLSGQVVELSAPALGVSASSSAALRYGMFFMAFLAAAGAVPYPFLRQAGRRTRTEEEPPPARRLAVLFTQLLLPDVILAFGVGSVLTFGQLYFHLRFRLDPGPVGAIMAVGGVIAGVGTLLTPLLARRWGNLRAAVRCQWAAVPMMAALALSMQLLISVPVYWLILTLRSMADPVYTAFVQEQVPEVYRARLTGLYSVTYSIGFSLGPAASGQLQKMGGFTPAFLMGAGCYLCGASLLYVFFGRRRTRSSRMAAAVESREVG
jgi:MFS family permease